MFLGITTNYILNDLVLLLFGITVVVLSVHLIKLEER